MLLSCLLHAPSEPLRIPFESMPNATSTCGTSLQSFQFAPQAALRTFSVQLTRGDEPWLGWESWGWEAGGRIC